jgi:cyclophilin family peptidyl-prolyl cis-trans isomerase
VGTAKRERQKANRQLRLAELQREQTKQKRKRIVTKWAVIVVIAVVAVFGLAFALGGNDDEPAATTVATTPATSTAPTSGASTVPAPTTVPGAALTGDTPCPPASGATRTIVFAKAPPTCIDASKTYTAKVETTKGSYTIALDAKAAPKTVNNFVVLARYGYYDNTPCHRILKGFMAQCGDPTGKGTGGPGYTFADELPAGSGVYKRGVVAMANSGPNTNGSQFFTMLGDNPGLGSNYSVFGTVSADGGATLDALNAVGAARDPNPPTEPVFITKVTITEA